MMKKSLLLVLSVLLSALFVQAGFAFDFRDELFEPPKPLVLHFDEINRENGYVNLNGNDAWCPTIPFDFIWGDGDRVSGFFPQAHTYKDRTRNYIITVTAHYSAGGTETSRIPARFNLSKSTIQNKVDLTEDIIVTIPDYIPSFSCRLPGFSIPSGFMYFDDSFFGLLPRADVEYTLSVAAAIQRDFVNDNIYRAEGSFRQYLMRDQVAGGMYSVWYSSPVSFGVGDYGFRESIQYSSFFHEMGHNFTLNTPAGYIYGGKIDGNANTIYSETMAQIFQHATAYEMLNRKASYGFDNVLALEIEDSARSSMLLVRRFYDDYVSNGKKYCSWNNPDTPKDDTLNTFMTIAYKFFEHAEKDGMGYRLPLKRMMALLQTFDKDMHSMYDRKNNTAAADAFRSTLLVAAMSYGFHSDLRLEFKDLGFPVDDLKYAELYNSMNPNIPDSERP